jgi:hypothetical protein
MKILHITYHHGCRQTIDSIMKYFGHEGCFQYANWNYNIGHNRAAEIWNKYKDYYNQFELIITSDTAPLSRILLQNNYSGKLIIWVCNRFDYCDSISNDCNFPDLEYYDIFRKAIDNKRVKIFSYTQFEHEYAEKYRNIIWKPNVIKPCSFETHELIKSAFPPEIKKEHTFFVSRYHNDMVFLKDKCRSLNIPIYAGEYYGIEDLVNIKGIIHIPYAWSNLALFENWAIGNVYFIPTKRFLFELLNQGNFFWSPPFLQEYINSSEWYLPEHEDLFIHFDSWRQLKKLTDDNQLLVETKQKISEFNKLHTEKTLGQWKDAIERWIQ